MTVILLSKPSLKTQVARMLARTEKGIWYDPSDMSTLFRDSAGTLPVTAMEQPVGLMLDKSKGLVVSATDSLAGNGDFNSPAYWGKTPVASITSGQLVFNGSSTAGGVYASASVTIGKYYEVSFDVVSISQGGIKVWVGVTQPVYTATTPGTHRYRVACTGDTLVRVYNNGTATAAVVDNVVVKEVFGNHAFNPSGNSANFPVLSARYNLLTKTEQFDAAVWVKTNLTATAYKLTSANLTGIQAVDSTSAAYPAGVYIFSIKVKSDGWRWVQLRTNISLSSSYVNFDVISGVKGTESGAIGSITALGANEYLISISLTFLAASGAVAIQLVDSGTAARNPSATGNGVSGIFVRDADLRVANNALNQPAYQRVNTATDYDTVGFKPYLSFNGVNQWLQTNSIDFTYGDKVFVAAGVRKLSDALAGVFAEISTGYGSAGSFGVYSPGTANSASYTFASSGTATAYAGSSINYASPITNVLSGIGNISGDQAILRVNGSQVASSTTDQGTGNYGNYPLYIGARAGSSLWFNGRLYGLVVAGKQASASEIASTESWLNQKTGAY